MINNRFVQAEVFSKELENFEDLYQAIANFTGSCAEKLRKQKGVCGQIQVFILTNYFREDLPQSYQSIVVPLQESTDSSFILITTAAKPWKKYTVQNIDTKKVE